MLEEVILVDSEDFAIGRMEKMEAHEKGLLHRAFSILIINDKGEMLLQQRAMEKYHSPGLGPMLVAVIHVQTSQI